MGHASSVPTFARWKRTPRPLHESSPVAVGELEVDPESPDGLHPSVVRELIERSASTRFLTLLDGGRRYGTGDPPISCDGLGVPIEDVDPTLQTVDQGPCGYTYRSSSPDDAPYQLAITAIYDIDWRTSDGRNGSLGTIRRTATVAYDIDEIQTVGGR